MSAIEEMEHKWKLLSLIKYWKSCKKKQECWNGWTYFCFLISFFMNAIDEMEHKWKLLSLVKYYKNYEKKQEYWNRCIYFIFYECN